MKKNKNNNPLSSEDIIFVNIFPNTELGIDLKLLTRRQRRLEPGEILNGVLRRDSEEHYTFVETPSAATRRNPQVFVGRRITVTRRSDGSLRPNFRPVAMGNDFDSAAYATEVANELLWALTSLVGKKAAR